jgi:transglutaminase superfamily protein
VPRRGPLEMDQVVRLVRRICRLRCFRGPLFPQACLRHALALYHLMGQLGYPVEIHFGVYKAGEALRGHSWVTVDGKPVAERLPQEALQEIYSCPASVSDASQDRTRAGRQHSM